MLHNADEFIEMWMNGQRVVSQETDLLNRLDNLGFTALKNEVVLLDEITRAKFIDEFAGANESVLSVLNNELDLLYTWRSVKHTKSEAEILLFCFG